MKTTAFEDYFFPGLSLCERVENSQIIGILRWKIHQCFIWQNYNWSGHLWRSAARAPAICIPYYKPPTSLTAVSWSWVRFHFFLDCAILCDLIGRGSKPRKFSPVDAIFQTFSHSTPRELSADLLSRRSFLSNWSLGFRADMYDRKISCPQ